MIWRSALGKFSRRGVIITALLVIAASVGAYTITALISAERENARDTVRANCQQIEQVKNYARDSALSENKIRQALKGVISPEQKAQFQAQTDKVVRDLAPRDCAKLPLLRSAP